MSLDAVIKIGGSLSRGEGLPALCSEIASLGRHHALLVVPGGGDFAEQVRQADRRFKLGDAAAHRMALLAMDQYGYLINQLIPGSGLTAELDVATRVAASGRAAVFLPSALITKEDPLPNSWQVTSDSIAAWISRRSGCRRLVLLKDVEGLFQGGALMKEMSPQQLAGRHGGVDAYLPTVLATAGLEVWIIDGTRPGRLVELLKDGRTSGTRICPF